jgi:hypothetical protein
MNICTREIFSRVYTCAFCRNATANAQAWTCSSSKQTTDHKPVRPNCAPSRPLLKIVLRAESLVALRCYVAVECGVDPALNINGVAVVPRRPHIIGHTAQRSYHCLLIDFSRPNESEGTTRNANLATLKFRDKLYFSPVLSTLFITQKRWSTVVSTTFTIILCILIVSTTEAVNTVW